MTTFNFDGIDIQLLKKAENLEIFEASMKVAGVGPGLHFHRNMEESFYIVSGKVLFTIEGKEKISEKGEFLNVPRNTVHSWKGLEKGAKLLLIFSPSNHQVDYFAELQKIQKQGGSWEKAIATLSSQFDNVPFLDF